MEGSSLSFPHEWLDDCRDPLFTFTWRNNAYGFFFMSIPTWIELLTIMLFQMLIAASMAVVIYDKILKAPRGSLASFVLTFGLFLPFFIVATKVVVEAVGIKNQLFLFCLCVVTPTTAIFRLLEAYFRFTPAHAARSVADYCLYFASPLPARFDKKAQKYVKTTSRVVIKHLMRFACLALTTGLYQSLFLVLPSFPKFGVHADADYYALRHVVDPAVWLRTALFAVLLQQYLTTFGEGLMFATNLLTGLQTEMRTLLF